MTDELIPVIRVGVDWDGDGQISYDDLPTDPLNTFPDNAILRDDQTMPYGDTPSWAVILDRNEYSPFAYYIEPTDSNQGIVFSTRTNYWTTPTNEGNFQAGSLAIEDEGDYTISVLVKAVAEGFTACVEVYDEDYFETGIGFLATETLDLSDNDWHRVDLTFNLSGGTYPRPLHLRVYNSTNDEIFEISYRATLVAGTTALAKFNDGTLRLYDNITPYIEAWDSTLGFVNDDTVFPPEGILTLTVNNEDRIFSPANQSSPLYGYLKKGRKVVVEVFNPVSEAWRVVWTGWIRGYEVHPTGNGDLQTKIKAEQGIFRLNEIKPNLGIMTNMRFDEVLDELLILGHFPGSVEAGIFDRSHFDRDLYFVDLDDIRTAEEGINTFPLLGDGWKQETTTAQILKEMLEVERGYFWIDRTGKILFYNRHHYKDTLPLDDTFSIDNEANDASYEFGGNVYNVIQVSYAPKEYVDGLIWKSKEPITVAAREEKQIDVTFETEDGTTISVTELSDFGGVGSSTVDAKTAGGATIPPTKYTIDTELKNGAAKIIIHNYYSLPLNFTIELHGTKINSYGSQTYTAEFNENSPEYESYEDEGKREKTFNNRLITTEDEAIGIGDYLLARLGLPRSQFGTIQIKSRDENWLDRMLNLTVGSYIEVDEYQTAFTQKLVIVGEKHSWRPGILTTTYTVVAPEYYTLNTLTETQDEFFVGY